MSTTIKTARLTARPQSYPQPGYREEDNSLIRHKSNAEWSNKFQERLPNHSGPASSKSEARQEVYKGVTDDNNVWSGRVVLSLDGGGIRGLSGLLIIQRLMEKIRSVERSESPGWLPAKTSGQSPQFNEERECEEMANLRKYFAPDLDLASDSGTSNFLPCHYFDYIAGTSTGALIATMLGRMWMSADQAMEHFQALATDVYRLRFRTKARAMKQVLKLDGSREEKIRETVQMHFPSNQKLQLADDNRCRTIICSYEQSTQAGSRVPYLFRSYTASFPDEKEQEPGLSDIMRATSCSPYYFTPVSIGSKKFCDTGLSWPNPTAEVWREVLRESTQKDNHACSSRTILLSIGGGYALGNVLNLEGPRSNHFSHKIRDVAKTIQRVNQSLSTIGEDVNRIMEELEQSDTTNLEYHRLNVPLNLSQVKQSHSAKEEVASLESTIRDATIRYLDQDKVNVRLEELARQLVDLRRQKSRTSKWEAFAFGVRYQCPIRDPDHHCDIKNMRVGQPQLIQHLRKSQNIRQTVPDDDVEIKKLVKEARTRSY